MDTFPAFQKIPRLKRGCVITEKIDGTNALVCVGEDGSIRFGSRSRWITPEDDNYGFARWGTEHAEDLIKLGPGKHYGEWWGQGIQRKYGLAEKRFSLFNVGRFQAADLPPCVSLVPVLYVGDFTTDTVDRVLADLVSGGSQAAPGFDRPEGVIVYLPASGHLYKVLAENDSTPKGVPC